jgi:hypothetical protein
MGREHKGYDVEKKRYDFCLDFLYNVREQYSFNDGGDGVLVSR